MFDPTKNTTCNGLLSDEDFAALAAWPHGWEWFNSRWVASHNCGDKLSAITYRGKPAPVTRDRWALQGLHPKWRWQARDWVGDIWLFTEKPLIKDGFWQVRIAGGLAPITDIADPSFLGTCDWRDSLIERPEGV